MKLSDNMKIITWFTVPPIPVRIMDWQATREGCGMGDAIGNGETELAAITDLLEQEALLSAVIDDYESGK